MAIWPRMAVFNPVSLIAFICGAGASMGMLILTTSKYESKFEDKSMFLTFAFGLGVGLLLGIGHAWIMWSYIGEMAKISPLSVLVVGLIMAVLTALVITVFTNRKAFFNTPTAKFIGLSVGLGLAGSLIFSKFFADLNYFYADDLGDPNLYMKLALYLLSALFVHAAAGIIQGEETSKGFMRIGILKSFGVLAPYYAALFIHYVYYDPVQQWFFLFIMTLYGFGFFLYFYKRYIINEFVTTPKRRLRSRRRR
jgi:hypothetical protein